MVDVGERIAQLRSPTASKGTYYDYRSFRNDARITWNFDVGGPDPATFPVDDLSRLAEQVLRDESARALQYGTLEHADLSYGYVGVREEIAERTLRREGRATEIMQVMLTSGGVQALTLACRAFLAPGDVMAVEAPTWGAVLHAATQLGAEALAIPMDAEGMRVDVLEAELARLAQEGRALKMLYTIATFNTPTGLCLSLPRRLRLLELADEYGFIVLEDDVYGELRYEGDDLPTLYSLDETGLVIKVNSFSKTLAPALRLGWVTGHPDAIATLGSVRGDLGVSQWLARLMARYLSEGLLDQHLAEIKGLYRNKRDVAAAALRERCGAWVDFRVPDGGFFLWIELSNDVDGAAVMKAAAAEGVDCRPGERFFGASEQDQHKQWFRLAYSLVPIDEIERGITALGKAIANSIR